MGLIPKQSGVDREALRTLHLSWLDQIADHTGTLSAWELQFVESVTEQLADGRYLSEKQARIIERLYEEKT